MAAWGFAHSWEILSALEDKIRIPARPCNILYLSIRTFAWLLFVDLSMPWNKFLLHDGRCKWTCLRKQWVSVFFFVVFISNGILPFRVLTNNPYTTVYTILFMNLIMISKVHQWNKTYFNRQSNDLQSIVELFVAQPSRSQVTGRKEPWERGCVLMSSCLIY